VKSLTGSESHIDLLYASASSATITLRTFYWFDTSGVPDFSFHNPPRVGFGQI